MPIARLSRCQHALPLLSLALFTQAAASLLAQPAAAPRWQRIGTAAFYADAPGLATGAVRRVWYSGDGRTLYALLENGAAFETSDFETWKLSTAAPPTRLIRDASRRPEPTIEVVADPNQPARLFAAGSFVYRSEDDGQNWTNMTGYRQRSILGATARDAAISPSNQDELTVAADNGIWRTIDGGITWSGLNQQLPNLPIRRLTGAPNGIRGVQGVFGTGAGLTEMEWFPGEKQAWQPAPGNSLAAERALTAQAAGLLGVTPTAVGSSGMAAYAGAAGGRLWYSVDSGRSWQRSPALDAGAPAAFFVDSAQPTTALVVVNPRTGDNRRSRVYRTVNGGVFWDDLTDNLPDTMLRGITADHASGAVYLASDKGVFYTRADLLNAAPATPWTLISAGLPDVAVVDVRLDASGSHLYAAVSGYGVYSATALRGPRDVVAVSTADLATRVAAPGSLMSVLGTGLQSTKLGGADAIVLGSTPTEMQIQVPFNMPSGTVPLAVESASGRMSLQMRLADTSPVIFLDPDGSPWLLSAETGTLLDAQHPARAASHLQILCTGLGRVKPEWPTGMTAPLADPPAVVAGVRALLGEAPLEVVRATLAPGYVGYYLVEVILPAAVNAGPSELVLELDGRASNRVRLYLEP